MFTDTELTELLKDLESDRVERKQSLSSPDRIREAICAFANDMPNSGRPGVLFVGVKDDGQCAGLTVDDDLLLNLAGMRGDGNILPFPVMTVQKRELLGCQVAVVVVEPSDTPPVRYNGRVWIRVGPRRATATVDEERRLSEKRRTHDVPFDRRAVPQATLEDLDLDLFLRTYLPSAIAPDVLAENHRDIEQQLTALHFLSRGGTPNVAALLVLGKDPVHWIPGAYLQFVRFDGLELTDPIRHQVEITGQLPDLLRRLDEVLQAQISVATDVTTQPTEVRHPDYPLVALQQIARNAVMHRNYETSRAPIRIYWFLDRIEIHSPGGPFGQVTEANMGQPGVTDYRNPLLAEVMKSLGYVQRFGLGFPLATRELRRNGNPDLQIDASASAVLITLRRRP
jgi:ATP-dependent DNA helicase RecG